jgi:plasmid maintenance system killer protein
MSELGAGCVARHEAAGVWLALTRYIPPGNDLHALKDDQAGRHAVKVNDQYKVTFRWEGHDAYDVCREGDH